MDAKWIKESDGGKKDIHVNNFLRLSMEVLTLINTPKSDPYTKFFWGDFEEFLAGLFHENIKKKSHFRKAVFLKTILIKN